MLKKHLARKDLGRFAREMMPGYELSDCHALIIEYLESLLSAKIKRLCIVAPPRHGKSQLANVFLPAFALGRNPKETVITVSYGADLSETFGRRVRNLLGDPAFREIFPKCVLSSDSQAAYRFETTAGGEFSATGRGGPITGKGASLLILDDLLKDQAEANSEATCRSIIEWLESVCFTRLTPAGRVIAVATRWSEKDPMGFLMAQAGWTVLHLPAFAEANDPLGRRPGEALWPGRFPIETLEDIKKTVGSRVFACLYQGNVSAAQGNVFKRDWFRHYAQPPERFKKIVQTWDTAFKVGASNDFSVGMTIGQTDNGFYVLSLFRDKLEFPALKAKVAELADQWHPSEIYVEDKASGQSLIQELKLATSYPVIAVKVDADKETRASATTGYYESGRVYFPEPDSCPWVTVLEDELANFPNGLHDDCVDTITQALNKMRDYGGALGWIDYLKSIAAGTRPMPGAARERFEVERRSGAKPVQTRVEGNKGRGPNPPACEACGNTSVIWMSGGTFTKRIVAFCNQCHAVDGIPPAQTQDSESHIHRWQRIPNGRRCDDCQVQESFEPYQAPGMSRADYNRGRLGRFN